MIGKLIQPEIEQLIEKRNWITLREIFSDLHPSEVADIIAGLIDSEVVPRSVRLNSSGISEHHPFVKLVKSKGIQVYGSPTTSDQAIIPFLSVKMGPGDSARSHTADEYILKSEILNGIKLYIELLEELVL